MSQNTSVSATAIPGIYITQADGSVLKFYEPLPHQLAFHTQSAPNVLGLGTRGTGKSLMLRMDAFMRCLAVPNFRALILRRSMPELRRSHLTDIEREMKQVGGYFHKTTSTAVFENGSTIVFGHVEDEAAVLNYLSSQYGFIGFDELSTFTLLQFLQIGGSARAPESAPYTAVVRAGSNPLGPGAGWMKKWFITNQVDYNLYPDYHPDDFVTLRSTLNDNTYLDVKTYRARLSNLPDHIRRAWLDGEFVEFGTYFSDFTPTKDSAPWHLIETLPTVKGESFLNQPWINIYRAIDWGFSPDPAVCLWIASLPNGRAIVFKEQTWYTTTAADVAKDIVRTSRGMRIVDSYSDPTMFTMSGHTGVSIGDYFESNGVPLTSSVNDRAAIGMAIHEYLNTVIDQEPKLQILRDCTNLVNTIPEMQIDIHDPKKIAGGSADHYVIALGYFCQGSVVASRDPERPLIPRWMRPKKSDNKPLGYDQRHV